MSGSGRGKPSDYHNNQYACAPLIDGLGHATWSGTVPVSRARTLSFQKNRHVTFHALSALKHLVSLLGRLVRSL